MNYDDEDIKEEVEEQEKPQTVYVVFAGILFFSFISMLFVFFTSIYVILVHNYGMATLYNVTVDMINNSQVPAAILNATQTSINNVHNLPNYFDSFWLLAFVAFAISSIISSYFAKRESYFSVITMLVFGIFIIMFVSGIFLQISEWFRDNIMSAFPSILPMMPKFTFYLNNIAVINLTLVFLCLFANFIDLDFSKFFNRKKKEDEYQEIQ